MCRAWKAAASSKVGIPLYNSIKVYGEYDLTCLNVDGSIAWHRHGRNGITNAGLDYLLGVMFSNNLGAFPQFTAWYAGIIDLIGFTTLAPTDTMLSHAGWKENLLYSGSRPQWANSESGQQVSSNGSFTFPITGNGTIHGLFITSSPTLNGTAGTLWATAILSSDAAISTGQSLTGTYQVTCTGG